MEELLSPGEKIGDFLIKIGAITKEQVEEILKIQKKEKKLFGQIAIELGYIDDNAIKRFIDAKNLL